jgi:DNA replicative helicase MCM subunit Mcm2 (Cdc46/Mcm family)
MSAEVEITKHSSDSYRMNLKGEWTREDLNPAVKVFRRCISDRAFENRNIQFDFSETG